MVTIPRSDAPAYLEEDGPMGGKCAGAASCWPYRLCRQCVSAWGINFMGAATC